MKKLLLRIALVLLITAIFQPVDLLAQSQDRVLVFGLGNFSESAELRSIVDLHFDGQVDHVSELPADISSYRAIFIYAEDAKIPEGNNQALIDYTIGDGKIFIQGFADGYAMDTTTLLGKVGLDHFVVFATSMHSTGMSGVSGSYAESFFIPTTSTDPLFDDVPGLTHAVGLTPVVEVVGGATSEAAWISPDTSLRFVMYFPHAQYPNEPFIAFTMCNYFNLCQLDVDIPIPQALELKYLPLSSEIILPSQGRVVVSDLLGRLNHAEDVSTDRFRLPSHLTSGTYLISWSSGDHRASIVIQHQ